MGVVGGVASGVIQGVAEAAAGVITGSMMDIAADDRIYRRGVRMHEEIFSH